MSQPKHHPSGPGGVPPADPRGGSLSKGRRETPDERADRNWNELLQELRVTQTGVQLLTGFLLTLPFQPRFDQLDDVQVGIYLTLVLLAAVTTVFVIAPVAMHRMLFQRRRKPETVRTGHKVARVGLAALGLVVVGTVLLVFDVVLGRSTAFSVAAGVLVLVAVVWMAVPMIYARRRREQQGTEEDDQVEETDERARSDDDEQDRSDDGVRGRRPDEARSTHGEPGGRR